jgi:hypothetical protein
MYLKPSSKILLSLSSALFLFSQGALGSFEYEQSYMVKRPEYFESSRQSHRKHQIEKCLQDLEKIPHTHFLRQNISEIFENGANNIYLGGYFPKDLEIPPENKEKIIESISRLLQISELNFVGSPFHSFPKSLKKMTHLKHLNLRGIGLKVVPSSIKYLNQLELLNLDNNELYYLPEELKKLTPTQGIIDSS